MKIILSGDLHLGRTSTRLPENWRAQGRSIRAWERLVDAVISAKADVLLLSGDLMDHRNHLWEAMGPLQSGIERLFAAGVRTFAVSGNHDATALPEFAAQFPKEMFTLLGKNGQWERVTLEQDGQPCLHLDGWSFPAQVVKSDPTLDYPSFAADGLPVLAMVHGDPGVSDSSYAPLSLSRLQSLPVSAWLLGHIHRPLLTQGAPWVLMPGSPHPLDPGEAGDHQAWQCELLNGQLTLPRPFCPAALRYDQLSIPISPEDSAGEDWIRQKIQSAANALPPAEMKLLRIRLQGSSENPEAWEDCCQNLENWTPAGFRVESVKTEIHPVLDLQQISETGPVQALLAKALQGELPADLESQLRKICEDLNRLTEFAGKELPQLQLHREDVDPLLENTLRKALEQIT